MALMQPELLRRLELRQAEGLAAPLEACPQGIGGAPGPPPAGLQLGQVLIRGPNVVPSAGYWDSCQGGMTLSWSMTSSAVSKRVRCQVSRRGFAGCPTAVSSVVTAKGCPDSPA